MMKPVKLSDEMVIELARELFVRIAAASGIILSGLALLALAGGRV